MSAYGGDMLIAPLQTQRTRNHQSRPPVPGKKRGYPSDFRKLAFRRERLPPAEGARIFRSEPLALLGTGFATLSTVRATVSNTYRPGIRARSIVRYQQLAAFNPRKDCSDGAHNKAYRTFPTRAGCRPAIRPPTGRSPLASSRSCGDEPFTSRAGLPRS